MARYSLAQAVLLMASGLTGASCGGNGPPLVVLADDSVHSRTAGHECLDTSEPRSRETSLSTEQRARVERILDHLSSGVSRAELPQIWLRIVPDLPAHAESAGNTIKLSAQTVLRLFGEYKREESADLRIAFILAHEIGHLLSSDCNDACTSVAACETNADVVAQRLLGRTRYGIYTPPADALLDVALERAEQSLRGFSALAGARPRRPPRSAYAELVEDCVQQGELAVRYLALTVNQATRGDRGSSDWERRNRYEDARLANDRSALFLELTEVCRHAVVSEQALRTLPDGQCYRSRLESSARALRALRSGIEPHLSLGDEWFLSDEVRWHDDAKWRIQPAFAVAATRPEDQGLSEPGPLARLVLAWQAGGNKDAVGVLLSYGRFRLDGLDAGGTETLDRYTGELTGWTMLRRGRHFGLELGFGFGGAYETTPGSDQPYASFSLEPRVIYRLAPRVHLGLGFGYGAAIRFKRDFFRAHTLTVPVLVDFHLGRYGI